MKQTRQKQIILDAVHGMHNHPTAEQVHREIVSQGHEVGIATVYRNLNSFAEQGLIKKIAVPNTPDRFDFRLDPHHHFVCDKCHMVCDADVNVTIEGAQEGLDYNSYSLTLHGCCKECS